MNKLPRLALGSFQADVQVQPLLVALLERLRRERLTTQVYLSRSQFPASELFRFLTGRCVRQLDSWLMTAETCRRSFHRGSQAADLSLVFGTDGKLASRHPVETRGTLDRLADWLALPRIALVDVSRFPDDGPVQLPAGIGGMLLARLSSDRAYGFWQRRLERATGIPVLGGLRQGLFPSTPSSLRSRRSPRWETVCRLCDDLSRRLDLDRLIELARQNPWPRTSCGGAGCLCRRHGAQVGIAIDQAFHDYDPDMLDMLEMLGAKLRDFSPLKAERLPPDIDLVLFGDGAPQRFAQRLAANVCLKQSLREHVRAGRRVYAEGGGLAYICQLLQVNGRTYPMAGLLPAIAVHEPSSPRPVELRPTHASWLFGRQTILRGYRNTQWQLAMAGPLVDLADDPRHRLDLVGFRQVIGSRVHLHFSSQPALLRNLIQPGTVKAR